MSKECTHGVRFGSLCAWCGEDLGPLPDSIAFPHSRSITFSEDELRKVVKDHVDIMKKCKKLSILIHMDQVILDSVLKSQNFGYEPPLGFEADFFTIETGNCQYFICLRPHLREFLSNLHDKFEMTLFTLREYDFAEKVLAKIDPDNNIFNTRIMAPYSMKERNISKTYYDSSKLMVILDVSSNTWRDKNGLPVEGFVEISPFCYFGNQPRAPIFPVMPSNVSKVYNKKCDNVLLNISNMLLKVHENYFNRSSCNDTLLDTLYNFQSNIFSNCCFCVDESLYDSQQDGKRNFFAYLSKFGAEYMEKYGSRVTHVITNRQDCPLVKEAQEYKGVFIVTFEWLIDSCINYLKMNEKGYLVAGVESPTSGQNEIDNPLSEKDLSSSEFERMIDTSEANDATSSSEEEESEKDMEINENETFEIRN